MNTSCFITRSVIVITMLAVVEHAGAQDGLVTSRIVSRGRHFSVIESVQQTKGELGQTSLKTNRYTLLKNGLNFRSADGSWVESRPVVKSYSDGIVCSGAAYQAIISTNINSANAIDLWTSDGKRIVSRPVAIGFFDPDSGESVLLAQIKDCPAEVVSNRVVFRDAFSGSNGVEAAVSYWYDTGQFHQDVTFLKQPAVTPTDFGMGGRARLEVLTEIIEGPVPTNTLHILKHETDPATAGKVADPDLVDETLDYGEMKMLLGRAFPADNALRQRGIAVAKRLLGIDGRTVLVEAVEWRDVQSELQKLAKQTAGVASGTRRTSPKRELPPIRVARGGTESFHSRLAQVANSGSKNVAATEYQPAPALATSGSRSAVMAALQKGYTIDYDLIETAYNFTFAGDSTYLVNSQVYLTGLTYFWPNNYIKYTQYASIEINDFVSGDGGEQTFTAIDDNRVGETIDGSTGNPNGYYAAYALKLQYLATGASFDVLNFRYVNFAGLYADNLSGLSVSVSSSSFTDSGAGVYAGQVASINLGSVYICNTPTLFTESTLHTVSIGSTLTTCETDSDSDGLPDAWEYRYLGNLDQGPNGDPDLDGYTNLEEYQNNTDPRAYNSQNGLTTANGLQVFKPLK